MVSVPSDTAAEPQRSIFTKSPTNSCSSLKLNGTSFAEWENIPDTLLLNGSFGVILLVTFFILTHIAWRKTTSGNDDDLAIHNQNIIHFLYGYRDPDHWYVIPRYEFLRPQDRHHQHDLDYPYLYIPPKLPLSNPIDAFVLDSDLHHASSKSDIDVPSRVGESQINQSGIASTSSVAGLPDQQTALTSLKTIQNGQKKTLTGGHRIRSSKSSTKGLQAFKSAGSIGLAHKTNNSRTFGQSFIYPSILTAEQLQASCLSRKLNRIFSTFFRVTDADIIYARGIDAYEYLLFQRHLILIMIVANVLCLGVILPIHWFVGTSVISERKFATSFQRTTIKNMNPNSHFHWAHIVCSSLIVIASLLIMNSYRESITTRDNSQLSRRTLLIGNIPQEHRDRGQLLRVIGENFSRANIEAVQFVYDFSVLYQYESYLSSAIVAKNYCRAYKQKFNRELMVHKSDVNQARYCDGYCRLCSFFLVCCFYWPREEREPGTDYYAKEEKSYRDKISVACEKLVKEPTEYAFVTFKTHKEARRVLLEAAQMKQEAFENRQPPMGFARSRSKLTLEKSTGSIPDGGGADPGSVTQATKNGATVPSSKAAVGASQDLNEHKSQSPKEMPHSKDNGFLESAHLHANPLDQKNNPHVRSIRSPGVLSKKKGDKTKAKGQGSRRSSPSSPRRSKSTISRQKQQQMSALNSDRIISGNINEQAPAIQQSKLEDNGPLVWSVRYAPHPDNVEFDDLRYLARVSKYTGILLHLLMILIFLFITTPNVLLSMFERIAIIQPDRVQELTGFQALLINYSSTLLQVIMTALLPSLITLISKQIPYQDSSSKDHSVMWKVYLFLILMVIVLPSIGMSSAQALFVSNIDPECLFPPDNGAYFINYVVSTTFLSTVLELIKPMDIVYYYFILWTSRSTAEVEGGRQQIEREFSVGLQHTSVLLIFSVVMTYAISCPLIAPAGLVFLIIKYSIDHYHLYYTYFTKKVDQSTQSTIVIFVKVALILMLFQTTVAIWLNTGTSYFSLISQIIFWITLAALVFNCFFDCTSRAMPAPIRRNRFKHEFCACFYLPRVVDRLLKLNAIPQQYISRKL